LFDEISTLLKEKLNSRAIGKEVKFVLAEPVKEKLNAEARAHFIDPSSNKLFYRLLWALKAS